MWGDASPPSRLLISRNGAERHLPHYPTIKPSNHQTIPPTKLPNYLPRRFPCVGLVPPLRLLPARCGGASVEKAEEPQGNAVGAADFEFVEGKVGVGSVGNLAESLAGAADSPAGAAFAGPVLTAAMPP